MNKRNKEIAQYLAEEGNEFSKELRNRNRTLFETMDCGYYATASAIALCWTGHAQYEDEFVEYAGPFIAGEIPKDSSISSTYSKRFGVENLDIALTNFRKFYRRVRDILPNFNECTIQDINTLQSQLLSKLDKYRKEGQIIGLGPWLFLGPFKIILGDQDRFWNNIGLNAIFLPTGFEVDRGMKRLKKEGYTFMKDFEPQWLDEDIRGDLMKGFANCNLVHAHVRKIAELVNSNTLHINSALYKYGRDEL